MVPSKLLFFVISVSFFPDSSGYIGSLVFSGFGTCSRSWGSPRPFAAPLLSCAQVPANLDVSETRPKKPVRLREPNQKDTWDRPGEWMKLSDMPEYHEYVQKRENDYMTNETDIEAKQFMEYRAALAKFTAAEEKAKLQSQASSTKKPKSRASELSKQRNKTASDAARVTADPEPARRPAQLPGRSVKGKGASLLDLEESQSQDPKMVAEENLAQLSSDVVDAGSPPDPGRSELHARNRHRFRYDFQKLCSICPDLAQFVTKNPYNGEDTIDFSCPDSVKTLNRALLKEFYGISDWDTPPGYLCPAIPGRADYIHYAADLLTTCNGEILRGKSVRVYDLGVGANCVYPLIGHKEYGWSFVGAEIDGDALASAQRIVAANGLQDAIQLRLQTNPMRLFRGAVVGGERYDLVVCNPPFHKSSLEAREGTRRKWSNLKTGRGEKPEQPVLNFGGRDNELWCKGGEEEFVCRMIQQSHPYWRRVLWFTTLVSQESNLPKFVRRIKRLNPGDIRIIPMGQGNKKSRILAWTFQHKHHHEAWLDLPPLLLPPNSTRPNEPPAAPAHPTKSTLAPTDPDKTRSHGSTPRQGKNGTAPRSNRSPARSNASPARSSGGSASSIGSTARSNGSPPLEGKNGTPPRHQRPLSRGKTDPLPSNAPPPRKGNKSAEIVQ